MWKLLVGVFNSLNIFFFFGNFYHIRKSNLIMFYVGCIYLYLLFGLFLLLLFLVILPLFLCKEVLFFVPVCVSTEWQKKFQLLMFHLFVTFFFSWCLFFLFVVYATVTYVFSRSRPWLFERIIYLHENLFSWKLFTRTTNWTVNFTFITCFASF